MLNIELEGLILIPCFFAYWISIVPAHVPLPHGRDDLERRVERPHRHVDPDLVVALAGATVRHGVGPLLLCHLDELRRR